MQILALLRRSSSLDKIKTVCKRFTQSFGNRKLVYKPKERERERERERETKKKEKRKKLDTKTCRVAALLLP
jgi:hypothetical protein